MRIVRGDALKQLSSGILVHGCNCQGVMGSGFAKSLKLTYPEVFSHYSKLHALCGLQLGSTQAIGGAGVDSPLLHSMSRQLPSHLVLVNAMTQQFFGTTPGVTYVDYDAVFSAFSRVRLLALRTGLDVHFPLLGAGRAQGDWARVNAAIRAGLREVYASSTLWVLEGAELPASRDPQDQVEP